MPCLTIFFDFFAFFNFFQKSKFLSIFQCFHAFFKKCNFYKKTPFFLPFFIKNDPFLPFFYQKYALKSSKFAPKSLKYALNFENMP